MSAKHSEGAPVVVTKTYDFVLWLLPKVEKFSRGYRFTIGDRLSASGLDLLALLAEKCRVNRQSVRLHRLRKNAGSSCALAPAGIRARLQPCRPKPTMIGFSRCAL